MAKKPRPGFAFKMPSESTLLIGVVGLVLFAMVAIPAYQTSEEPAGPAADAREAYNSLRVRIGSPAADGLPTGWSNDTLQTDRMPLQRDLFAPPQPQARAQAHGEAPPVTKPAPTPELTGILLDGALRRAVINGQRVAQGDWIGDYRVIRIESEWVMLRKDETYVRLELGGK